MPRTPPSSAGSFMFRGGCAGLRFAHAWPCQTGLEWLEAGITSRQAEGTPVSDAAIDPLFRLAASEHDLLACHHAAERATRRPYLRPVTGIILAELRRFHGRLLSELERLSDLPAIAVLVEDHRWLDLCLAGLQVRYERGDDLMADIDDVIGDWYRLHAIRHAWVEQRLVSTPV